MIFIVMGASGCGKSTVGTLLAERLGWNYIEGDDYHPEENKAKMTAGIPLQDADRKGWLLMLRSQIEEIMLAGGNAVLTCSALKQSYRDILKREGEDIEFIFLKGSYEQLKERMDKREGHFMKSVLLQSQLDTLEEPADAFVQNIALPPGEIVNNVETEFRERLLK